MNRNTEHNVCMNIMRQKNKQRIAHQLTKQKALMCIFNDDRSQHKLAMNHALALSPNNEYVTNERVANMITVVYKCSSRYRTGQSSEGESCCKHL